MNDSEAVPLEELDTLLETGDDDVATPALLALDECSATNSDVLPPRAHYLYTYLSADMGQPRALDIHLLTKLALADPDHSSTVIDNLLDVLAAEAAKLDGVDLFIGTQDIPRETYRILPPLLDSLKALESEYPSGTRSAIDHFERLLTALPEEMQVKTLKLLVRLSEEHPAALEPLAPHFQEIVAIGPERSPVEDEEIRTWLGRSDPD